MAATSADTATLSSIDPVSSSTEPEVVDKRPSLESTPVEAQPQSAKAARRASALTEVDPKAFRITILLASSGYRAHISVNRSFLEKASSVDGDGFLISQLKAAIWKDWPSEWPDPLPPSPNFLRLIYGGKMLPDKSTLAECNIGPGKPNTIHLSIRPADFVDDEYETSKKIPGIPRRSNGGGCCNCTIS